MNTEPKEFPMEIQKIITRRLKESVKVTFYNGATVSNSLFNFTIVEPFKILFQNRRKTKFIVVYIIETINNEKAKYEYFIDSIAEKNKKSMTAIANIVNESL